MTNTQLSHIFLTSSLFLRHQLIWLSICPFGNLAACAVSRATQNTTPLIPRVNSFYLLAHHAAQSQQPSGLQTEGIAAAASVHDRRPKMSVPAPTRHERHLTRLTESLQRTTCQVCVAIVQQDPVAPDLLHSRPPHIHLQLRKVLCHEQVLQYQRTLPNQTPMPTCRSVNLAMLKKLMNAMNV